jgi:hypothetical protein
VADREKVVLTEMRRQEPEYEKGGNKLTTKTTWLQLGVGFYARADYFKPLKRAQTKAGFKVGTSAHELGLLTTDDMADVAAYFEKHQGDE